MDSDDGTFRKGTKIEDWSNKIYVMDTTSSQIWKYSYKGSVGRFGTAEKYFAEDNDISGAVDFAIDSSVYVLFNNGDLNKFYGGSKAEFYINKPPLTVLKTPAAVYTSERLDEVYVLDSQESRVLVYDKDSQTGNVIYNRQYLLDSVGEIRDMYIEPDTDTLYVLTPTQVLEINITQAAPVVVDDEALAEETE